jgi:hypothetical protein
MGGSARDMNPYIQRFLYLSYRHYGKSGRPGNLVDECYICHA